jgi:hypothetical protein
MGWNLLVLMLVSFSDLELDPGKPQTLALHFGSEDFIKLGLNTKLYKLERDKPIYQIISAICKKFSVPNYRRYSFQTLAGLTLDDNDGALW